jgi:serine/threonine-protein kinase
VFALGVVFHEMLTGRRLFQAKNDITKMRQLLTQTIVPPSSLNATIPRELDRIVMRSLAIDVTERYQTTADMASDLERTLIAARYSSRELSKLLHGLFLPDEDPLVVVDTDDHRTVAVTASSPGTGSGGSGQTATATSSGSRTSGSRSTSSSQSTPGSRPTSPGTQPSHPTSGPTSRATSRPTSPSTSITEPIPDVADVRPADSGAERLGRVVLEEQGRLARKRLRLRIKVLAIVAAIVVGGAVVVGAAIWAARRYLPVLLAPPPPPPKPALPLPLPNQEAPEPAKPAKKKPPHKKTHGTAPSAATPADETAPAADEPIPPAEPR